MAPIIPGVIPFCMLWVAVPVTVVEHTGLILPLVEPIVTKVIDHNRLGQQVLRISRMSPSRISEAQRRRASRTRGNH